MYPPFAFRILDRIASTANFAAQRAAEKANPKPADGIISKAAEQGLFNPADSVARDELAGTTSHPAYEHWTCGTAHIRAQRILRIIERSADYGLTSDLIDRLDGLVDDAGPADCRRALTEAPDAVPF
ncbi:hypothetical protein AI27_05590 [Sphingomonas sp. BHC-A]|nr:hypothetical protein AI27_05590 [Sphingomonas sp. BHC-A]